jgi:regulatory protein
MTIVSLKTEADGNLNRIELSDGSLFSFRLCYLPPELFNINLTPDTAQGREITAAEEAAFRHASACLRAEKAALRLIARAEQCTAGLSRKLQKRRHEASCAGAVISRLSELRLLDDNRFARLWLQSRLRFARSPRRLLLSLCARGIDRDDAEAALKAVLDEEAEFALLARFAKKHARKAARSGDGEDVTRSLKYLLKSEGFSHAAIQRFLDIE